MNQEDLNTARSLMGWGLAMTLTWILFFFLLLSACGLDPHWIE